HLAIHALEQVVAELTPLYGADCPVAVVVEATRPAERAVRGTLGDIAQLLAAEPVERTALIMVGHALGAQDFRESSLYDPNYQRRFRGRE
ncbi:MAG TPA: precorrin-4 C(11)-methyltransferase, partial [Ancylobacter sp.]